MCSCCFLGTSEGKSLPWELWSFPPIRRVPAEPGPGGRPTPRSSAHRSLGLTHTPPASRPSGGAVRVFGCVLAASVGAGISESRQWPWSSGYGKLAEAAVAQGLGVSYRPSQLASGCRHSPLELCCFSLRSECKLPLTPRRNDAAASARRPPHTNGAASGGELTAAL